MTTTAEENVFRLSAEEREAYRELIWEECGLRAAHCSRCGLCEQRKTVVFGEGRRDAALMFIGEGPGADEDEQGRPFVGSSGKLLTQILEAAGIDRREVYITNVVKCRPPGNRAPTAEEMAACDEYLMTQIMLVRPRLIVLLGNSPMKWILKTTKGITKLRGRWFDWRGIAVMPMFHPSYLLRYPDARKQGSPKHCSWIDIQEVKKRLDIVNQTGNLGDIQYG